MVRAVNFLSVGLLLTIILGLGRAAGFFREIFLAHTYGATVTADLAVYALTLPDFLVNLFLSGGLTVALIPLISRNPQKIGAIFFQTLILVLGFFALIVLLLCLLPSVGLLLFAPGLYFSDISLTSLQIMMLGLAVMFTAFSGVTGAILNANNKFFIVGGGTLIFNVSVIVFIYFESLDEVAGLNWFCIGVAVGALIRLVTQLFSISRATYTGFQRGWLLTAGFVKLFIYGLASTALLVTLPIIVRSGISIFGEGHLSIFNYSLKLVELPNAIFISSVLIVAYPKLCSAIQKKDSAKMHDLIHKNITKLFAISFVIFLVGASYSDLIVNFLFGQSPISQDDLKKISAFTQIGFSSIPFVAIGGFFMALINALGYSKYVLLYSFYAAILTSLIVMFGYQFRSQNLLVLSLPLAHLFLSALCYQFLRKNSYVFGHIFKKCIKTMILLCIMFYFFWEFEVYVYSKLMQLTDGFYLLIMRLLCISFIFLSLISVGLFLNRGGLNGEKTV